MLLRISADRQTALKRQVSLVNCIQLPKPHGYLLWRGKQTSIASDAPLPTGQKLMVISESEAYGEAVLGQPSAVSLSEFERLEDEHCIRPEERKLYWPGADVFYIHRLKDWQPFERAKMVSIAGGQAELVDLPELTTEQKELLLKAERLPKTVVLLDDAVTLQDGKAVIRDGLDSSKIEPILRAVLDGVKSSDNLSLYQLALVRLPRLVIGLKKSEVGMPYKIKKNADGCKADKPYGVVNTGTGKTEGCSESEMMAKEHMAAMYANEKKKAIDVAEGEKCGDMVMKEPPMPYVPWGILSFADLQAAETAQEISEENTELTQQFGQIAANILNNPDPSQDKPAALAALAAEYTRLIQQNVTNPSMEDGGGKKQWTQAEDGSGESREDSKAKWTAAQVNDLPDSSFLYIKDGGEKDEEGKTKPRSLRMFPYKDASGKVDLPHLRNAIARIPQADISDSLKTELQDKARKLLEKENKGEGETAEGEKVGKRMAGGMLDKLKSVYAMMTELLGWAQGPEDDEGGMMGMMGKGGVLSQSKGFAIKQVQGKPWFIAYSTNSFEDREGEIFSLKSLEQYVSEAEKSPERGWFNFWHVPGTDFAKKEWQGIVGRFLVEAGPFLDNDRGRAALKFFRQYPDNHPTIAPEGWGMSPEYRYLPEERKSGTYSNIWITRSSVLPRLAAANIWTKGTTMALSKEQEQAAKAIFGDDLAAQIFKGAEDATKELEKAGVAHKSTDQAATDSDPKPVESPLDQIAEAVVKQLGLDFQPFIDGMTKLAAELATLQVEVKSLQKQEAAKQKTETPRFVFSLQRASQDDKTIVAEDDALKAKKPQETQAQDKSGAAAFFPARQ